VLTGHCRRVVPAVETQGACYGVCSSASASASARPPIPCPETDTTDWPQCTGENPCQRCIDNGKRCFYSEDQTAAEVLQNLSRPTPAAASHPTFGNSNGATRQHVTPRIDGTNRPPSDSGMAGATLEDRMARIEAIMEALLQERNMACTPTGTMEREDSEGCKSDMAFSMPILDPIHPDLDQIPQQSPELIPHPTLAVNPAMAPHAAAFVRAGNDNLPFPDPARYQQYVAHFFGDIHLRHPCVSESDFNGRTQRVVTNGATDPSEVHFLAVCFVVFACCDAVLDTIPSAATHRKKVPGWHWLQLADSVIDTKPAFRGCEDLALIQYHLFRVRVPTTILILFLPDRNRRSISATSTCLRLPTTLYAQPAQPLCSKTCTSRQHGQRSTQNRRTGNFACFGTSTLLTASSRYHVADQPRFTRTTSASRRPKSFTTG
jgi:hypothetical protein